MESEHVDVIIVGAGLSGIGAARHLQMDCPDRSYRILESRSAIGGTWDLFRYPGIRSDSDMFTLGYAFKPWTGAKAIADGASILDYVREAAHEAGIDRHITFGAHVEAASWSSADACWTVKARGSGGDAIELSCNFLFMCAGYYNYARGHAPEFAGADRFHGRIVHPQFWPDDLDYVGKKVVVIGSGATAVTLVPELAKQAAHVTMLQRSPTYVVSRPAEDRLANSLRRYFPARLAYALIRWRNVLLGMYFYKLSRRKPAKTKQAIIDMVRDELGADYDVATHFTPHYNPWDQRLCLVPDSDLFAAIREGSASVVTDTIETYTATGIRLTSGAEIDADIVVTATGLEIQVLGNTAFTVDGAPADIAKTLNYKGMMFSDMPNLASSFGYTNASWTLKADLTAAYVCRLLNTMKARGMRQATPRMTGDVGEEPFLDFSSGYVQRALHKLPKQGSRKPWKLHQNYALDLMTLKFGSVDDSMEFSNPEPTRVRAA